MVDAVLWYLAISLFGPLAVLTLAPLLLKTGTWVVRAWDFPRLQLAALTGLPAIPLVVLILCDATSSAAAILLLLLLAMAVSGLVQMLPFTRLWAREVGSLKDTERGATQLSLLVANICYESDRHEQIARTIQKIDPDLMLLIEIDEPWRGALDKLTDEFQYRIESINGEGLGLALWSKHLIRDGQIEHLISDRRPSIFANVEAPDGRIVRFVGLHPTPPGLRDRTGEDRRDSRVRDAELVLVAKRIAEDPHQNWVVAGDFNDVAWSHTTRLFKRLSGMLDPRVGRKLMNTYHSGYWYLRFPLDHLFLAPGIRIGQLHRIELPGSDHFGVLATIALEPKSEAKPTDPEAGANDEREAREVVEDGTEDAQERGVKA